MSDESEYKECEFCQNDIPILNFHLHAATCSRHHYKCPKCGEFVSLSGREEHEQMNHSKERCEKCGISYKPIDKASHVSLCPSSSVSCEFCDSSVIRKDFKEHSEACGARTERCESCGRYVMLKETTTHVCRLEPPQDFTERIGTMFSSDLEQREDLFSYQPLPFSNPYSDTHFNDTIRSTVPPVSLMPPVPFMPPVPLQVTPQATHSPIEPPNFVSLSSLEARLPQDGDSNSTGVQLEFEPDPTAPCEFCGNQLPLSALDGHQENCKFRVFGTGTKYCLVCKQMIPELEFEEHSKVCRPRNISEKFNQSIGSHYSRRNKLEPKPDPKPLHSSSLIPCEFCKDMFEFSEIFTHQTICPERNLPMEFGPISLPEFSPSIEKEKCRFCLKYFENFEIENHKKYCLSKPRSGTETKCQFCLKKVSLERLPLHLSICPNKPEEGVKIKCTWCLESFDEELFSEHENTCSYRNVKSRRSIHELELPFSDVIPSLKIERKKSETIDNKCQFCRFPQPAFDMENHQNKCQKNPKFRQKVAFDISPMQSEIIKSQSPELAIPPSRMAPRLEPIKSDPKTHEKAPKYGTESERNPFSRDQSNPSKFRSTPRTMDTVSSENYDSRYKQEPHKSTKTTTNYQNFTPYSLYSRTDPSPKYANKQQQTDTITSPISQSGLFTQNKVSPSPTELFRTKNEQEFAFKNLKTDTNNLRFQPSKFRCELKQYKDPSVYTKPNSLNISDTSPVENKLHLTPTQDIAFQLSSAKLRNNPVLSSSFPHTNYTDYTGTNTSFRPALTSHKPELTFHKPEPVLHKPELFSYKPGQTSQKPEPFSYKPGQTSYKPEPTQKPGLSRKFSPGQTKYPRHTSPRNGENEPSDTYRYKSPSFVPKDRDRDISYPPSYNPKDSYTRTSSSGTETIIEPSHSIPAQRKTPTDFTDRYKRTSNYK